MGIQELPLRKRLVFRLAFVVFLALDIWFLFVQGHGLLQTKMELFFEIIAFYAFVFGFLMQTGILKDFKNYAEDMTSPNLNEFISGNAFFVIFLITSLAGLSAAAADIDKARDSLLELPMLIVSILLTVAYILFHIVVIVPIMYIPYAIVSFPIKTITSSIYTVGIESGDKRVSFKDIVSNNEMVIKNLLIALPAAVVSLVSKIIFTLG